jgi:UDP-2,4-diacetamido-2,4,6-trideoxy-beta-L-altropyranose hydrolase
LASEWQARGGTAVLLSHCENPELRQVIESAGVPLVTLNHQHPEHHDLESTLTRLEKYDRSKNGQSNTVVVIDGYHFDCTYQRAIRASGCTLAVIDDYAHLERYEADVILNQNLGAGKLTYHCDSATRLLLGVKYALLRPEFMQWRGWKRSTPDVAVKLLITLGASDPENVGLKVVRALQALRSPQLEVRMVSGPANVHLEALVDAAASAPMNVSIIRSASNMSELMAWADLAISAAGSSCWELAYMGLPAVLIVLAENQRLIADELSRSGVAVSIGDHEHARTEEIGAAIGELIAGPERRADMSRRGRLLVDGLGARRVRNELAGMVGC